MTALGSAIRDETHLEDSLSEPTAGVIDMFRRLSGDVIILGVGGKMGPSLARLARRGADASGSKRRIIGVARFSRPGLERQLQSWGIETMHCDLLEEEQVACLPEVPLVIAMSGMKFGATGQEALTWAMNSHVPTVIAGRFRHSRIVAFSTGNVYGLTPVRLGGSRECDALNPVGEYAWSCLGRERLYEFCSRRWHIPMAIVRLNYATEMRYGVLVDVARRVWQGETVDVTMGHLNAIWQGDANAMALCALEHTASPPWIVNLAGPEILSVRQIALDFGRLMNKPVNLCGAEADDALLSNSQQAHGRFGYPRVPVAVMIEWIADWVQRGGANLGKPTHFEVRDGRF